MTPQRVAAGMGGGHIWGAASSLCDGLLRLGAHPLPAARPWGRRSGSTAHMLWVRVCRGGGPAEAPCLECSAGRCVPWGWRDVAQEGAPPAPLRGIWG